METAGARSALVRKLIETPHGINQFILGCVSDGSEAQRCAMVFDVLFDIKLSPSEAIRITHAVLENQHLLEERLSRSVDFRVAALDYFFSTGTLVSSPKITELGGYEGRMRLASVDELTGLYNRRFVAETLHRELHRSRRYGMPFSLLFLDIDDFKKINDNYGHLTGDAVLRNFASYLRLFLRSEDVVGRYGGEEFLIIMPQTDTEGARMLGNRLLEGLMGRRLHPDVAVSFSGGIASYPVHGQTIDALIEMADMGLYRSKMRGKRQIQVSPAEKRRDRRYPGSRVPYLELECSRRAGDRYRGAIRNLSRTGISFEAEEPLSIGDTVALHVHSRKDQRALEIVGKVVWTSTVADPLRYRVGARYSENYFQDGEQLVAPLAI